MDKILKRYFRKPVLCQDFCDRPADIIKQYVAPAIFLYGKQYPDPCRRNIFQSGTVYFYPVNDAG